MTIEQWLGEDNQLGIDIWKNKYQFNGETFDEWLDRVSGGNERVRQSIVDKKFLFGGRILSNRGLEKLGQKVTLSNCYVLAPPEDNIESIFECASKMARTFSYGGGVGIDISKLSPHGAKVNNTAKETSGAVSFMDLYSMVTGLIGQNGRRGALMISISCNHPDLEEFIDIKSDLDRVTKANISIRITNEFMKAVKDNTMYDLTFTRKETGETITKTVDAHEVFKKLATMNWNYAEPGCLFWDRIENWNLLSNTEEFEFAGTNPCAEEPLPAGGSCLLGSINLAEFVVGKTFDYKSFEEVVGIAIIALNEVLDEGLMLHPLQEQKDSVADWRQIGLGIMGLADMLIKMEVTYGSQESLIVCNAIASRMINAALYQSAVLAESQCSYPKFKRSDVVTTPFFIENASSDTKIKIDECGLRNSQLLTIAPTGTLSTMLGISGGMEPIFANYYERTTNSLHDKDVTYKVYTDIVKRYMEENGIQDDKDLPEFFITAQTLNYQDRIKMQSVWQKHIDASISSTVNVPIEFTVEDTEDLYFKAWEAGLKGITIFRDGCKRAGVLTTHTEEPAKEEIVSNELKRGEIVKVSDDVIGKKRKLITGCGTLHCTAFFDYSTGELLEVYLSKGSTGGCNNFMVGLSRMISLSARGGIDIQSIVDQLKSSGACPSYAVRSATKHDTSLGSCCPMAVGNALLDMYHETKEELNTIRGINNQSTEIKSEVEIEKKEVKNPCPTCGEELAFEGGCNVCKACGWSKCS